LVSAGLTALLMPAKSGESGGLPPLKLSGCDDSSVNSLVKQAQDERAAMKQKLDELKAQVEEAEQTAGGLSDDAIQLQLDEKWDLYVNKKYGFSMRLPRAFEADSALCEIDRDGIHSMRRGALPVTAVEDWAGGVVYLVPEYHYTAERRGNQTACIKVKHDLAAVQSPEIFVGSTLPITVRGGLADEPALLGFVREKFGETCDITTLVTKGTEEQPLLKRVAVVGGATGSGCLVNYLYNLYYQPAAGRAFLLSLGQDPIFGVDTSMMTNSFSIF